MITTYLNETVGITAKTIIKNNTAPDADISEVQKENQ